MNAQPAPAPAPRKPNVFLVGAPKAGTTSLARVLAAHPDFYMSPIKEPCHFCTDVRQQMARLLGAGWVARTPWERLQHLPRYLKAASLRLDKLRADPARDARLAAELSQVEQPYRRDALARARQGTEDAEFMQFGWLLEELRVSLFAQKLRTPVPVSTKRLSKLWETLRR